MLHLCVCVWTASYKATITVVLDHVKRTDHGEYATPRRVDSLGPNIAYDDLVHSLHMFRGVYCLDYIIHVQGFSVFLQCCSTKHRALQVVTEIRVVKHTTDYCMPSLAPPQHN